jgi:hypothetical protein
MEEVLLKKKEKLQREIEVAEGLLRQNIEEANFKNYLSIGSSLVPGLLGGLFKHIAIPSSKSEVSKAERALADPKVGSTIHLFSLILNALRLMRKS